MPSVEVSDREDLGADRVLPVHRNAARDGIQFLAREDLLVLAVVQALVGVRRVVRNHEDRIAVLQADGDVDALAFDGVDPADQRERAIGPLVLLDAAVVDRLEERESAGGVDRPRLEIDVRAVVMGPDDAGPGPHGLGPDDDQDDRAIVRDDREPRPRLDLRGVRELREARGLREAQHLASGRQRAARDLQVALVLLREAKDLVLLAGGQLLPRRLPPLPDAASGLGLAARGLRLLRREQDRDAQADSKDPDRLRLHQASCRLSVRVSYCAAVHADMPPTTLVTRSNPRRSSIDVAIDDR